MKNKNVIVHVKNEQEWDIIKKECPNSSSAMFNALWSSNNYPNQEVGIHINSCSYCYLEYYKKNHSTIPIISFEEYQTGFIVGKWYKFSSISNKSYAKFSKLSDNKFWFKECIDKEEGYKNVNDWWAASHNPTLLTDLSEIQEFLPDGHEDKFTYVFPKKWCIKQNASQKACDWSNIQRKMYIAKLTGTFKYILSNYDLSNTIPEGFTEITAEQFEKYVLMEKKIKEWSIGTYVVAIKEGCANSKPNDKYNIGFIDTITHFYENNNITGLEFSLNICNKEDFKWFATLEEAEEFSKTLTKKDEFKKGEYIVTLEVRPIGTQCAKNNYCFQVSENSDHLNVKISLANSGIPDGNTGLTFNKKQSLVDWRYASPKEIDEYNRIGKPYDVTTLSLTELIKDEYLHITYNNIPYSYIVIGNGDFTTKNCLSYKQPFYYKSNIFSTKGIKIRKATQDEIEWLDACIKADRYVDKPVTKWVSLVELEARKAMKISNNVFLGIGGGGHTFLDNTLEDVFSKKTSMSVKIRNKKPETQTVTKRVKLNFQINQSKLSIKLRNSHGSN